jgi:hypothetical protein
MVAVSKMALAVHTDMALATSLSDAVKGSRLAKEGCVLSLDASSAPSTDAELRMTVVSMLSSIELPEVPLLPKVARSRHHRESFSQRLAAILAEPTLDGFLQRNPAIESDLLKDAKRLAQDAYPGYHTTDRQTASWIDNSARDELHRGLVLLYQQHMKLPQEGTGDYQFHPLCCRLMFELEAPWKCDMLRRARAVYDLSPAALPARPDAFAAWYRDTAFAHPLYEHDLYTFVASEANRRQLEWFFRMECAGEAAFDDLVALAQVGTRGEVKIEMASNYWDEIGRGRSHAVHTHLFHKLISDLALEAPPASDLPWQILAGVNVMLWCSIPRRNAFRAQGALGAVELLAPQRCTRVVHGALRVGIRKKTVVYYGAHAIIDIGHAEGWLSHVIEPQVRSTPHARTGIAEGLIVRADASLDYFDYCLAHARTLAA